MGVAVQKREGIFDGGWNVLRHIVAECVPIMGRNSIDFCELLIGLFKKSVLVFWQARADAVVSTSAQKLLVVWRCGFSNYDSLWWTRSNVFL